MKKDIVHKPPLGLMPRWLFLEKRLEEIDKAINRRLFTRFEIPIEWIGERDCILNELKNNNK